MNPSKELEITPEYPDDRLNDPPRAQEIFGFPYFKTVTAAPTKTPRDFSEQVVILFSGGVYKLSVYETTTKTWKSVTIT